MTHFDAKAAHVRTVALASARSEPMWYDSIPAKVSLALLLNIILAIPVFFLLLQERVLIFYYLVYPLALIFGVYLRFKGFTYLSSAITVLAVYAVVLWMNALIGWQRVTPLTWYVLALLPWLMFNDRQRFGLYSMTVIPIAISLYVPGLQPIQSPLLPAEQEFFMQILRVQVGVGAFGCIFYLRQQYLNGEKFHQMENEFYSNTLDAIPLPIVIKDGITLEYLFFNKAAQLTYDLNSHQKNSNATTFSESSAAAVTHLDQEVLRSVTYHIENDENLVHQTGLSWHFRTYRIPLEMKSTGRRLLITISEDLRALNLVLRKAEDQKALLHSIYEVLDPLVVRYGAVNREIRYLHAEGQERANKGVNPELQGYLEQYFSHLSPQTAALFTSHTFTLGATRFIVYHNHDTGIVIALRD